VGVTENRESTVAVLGSPSLDGVEEVDTNKKCVDGMKSIWSALAQA